MGELLSFLENNKKLELVRGKKRLILKIPTIGLLKSLNNLNFKGKFFQLFFLQFVKGLLWDQRGWKQKRAMEW